MLPGVNTQLHHSTLGDLDQGRHQEDTTSMPHSHPLKLSALARPQINYGVNYGGGYFFAKPTA
jgi:hypothetical protein